MATITELCEQLADAYDVQGVPVRENLRPGISREDLLRAVAPLRIAVPDEVIELYSWRNGHFLEFDPDLHRNLRFRDGIFLPADRIVDEYSRIQRVDLRATIPISAFEGAWYVVACGAHLYGSSFDHPVVHVHQGIDMYFHSTESMLRTCIDWVSSPYWENLSSLPEDFEMAVWRRHNPGVFGK